ncbi:hypothetical protein QCA50_019199 [Cerrena zonata]|uniref:Retrotransposon gag domain-containing protein n=1 Tax=Cerrena zonata TaxID=2478898 RepID=A0AAW0FCW9_9APHY
MTTRTTTSTVSKKKKKTPSQKGKEREEITPTQNDPSSARPSTITEEELTGTISDNENPKDNPQLPPPSEAQVTLTGDEDLSNITTTVEPGNMSHLDLVDFEEVGGVGTQTAVDRYRNQTPSCPPTEEGSVGSHSHRVTVEGSQDHPTPEAQSIVSHTTDSVDYLTQAIAPIIRTQCPGCIITREGRRGIYQALAGHMAQISRRQRRAFNAIINAIDDIVDDLEGPVDRAHIYEVEDGHSEDESDPQVTNNHRPVENRRDASAAPRMLHGPDSNTRLRNAGINPQGGPLGPLPGIRTEETRARFAEQLAMNPRRALMAPPNGGDDRNQRRATPNGGPPDDGGHPAQPNRRPPNYGGPPDHEPIPRGGGGNGAAGGGPPGGGPPGGGPPDGEDDSEREVTESDEDEPQRDIPPHQGGNAPVRGNTPGYDEGQFQNASATDWIRQAVREKLGTPSQDLPALRQLKLQPPGTYDGRDDIDIFDSWMSQICRWMRLARLCSPELDSERVDVLGTLLTGEALQWYNSVIDNPNRLDIVWDFESALVALYTRFVHQSTVLTATERFEGVRYTRSGGAIQLANQLNLYSSRMVVTPDSYTIRRRLWSALPDEITTTMGRVMGLSAERTSLNELVRVAAQIENSIRADVISRQMRATTGQSSGPNPNSQHNTVNTGSANHRSNNQIGSRSGSNDRDRVRRNPPPPSRFRPRVQERQVE